MSAIPFPRPHLIQGGDQRSRYAGYLRARDLLLQVGRGASTRVNAALHGLQIPWALGAARRTIGSLTARHSLTRLMRVRGIPSLLVWAVLGTRAGIAGITKAYTLIRSNLAKAVSTVKASTRKLVVRILARNTTSTGPTAAMTATPVIPATTVQTSTPIPPIPPKAEVVPDAHEQLVFESISSKRAQGYPAKRNASTNRR